MAFSTYAKSPEGRRVILGSGFLWAWLDCLFMSALFLNPGPRNVTAEFGMILTFLACSLVAMAFVLSNRRSLAARIQRKRVIALASLSGCLGSFAYIATGMQPNPVLMALGGIGTGIFMCTIQILWGLVYCRDGARSAAPYVAGGFACAPLIDIPLLLMVPLARAFFFSLLPLVSGLFLASVLKQEEPKEADEDFDIPSSPGIRRFFHQHLGISSLLLFAVVLVMTCFGYLQHFISFDTLPSEGLHEGIVIQFMRGVTAIALFLTLELKPALSSTIYRIGFLVMIAGVMTMPFSFGTSLFLVSGMLIIAGYTVFDLFTWVAFSHIARTQSKNMLRTIAVIRLFASLCAAVGCGIALALSMMQESQGQLASQETTFVGYLVVIATVLLISSDESRVLLRNAQPPLPVSAPSPEKTMEERLAQWGDEMHFTAREKEIAVLLAQGRTQPRIADMLGISENTVGTHVRHIYQKTEVHNRQQFIDLAFSVTSPESREKEERLTDSEVEE